MKKRKTLFGIGRNINKTIDEMAERKKRISDKPETENEKHAVLIKKQLACKTFRFNQETEACEWVNTNNIQLATIAADGNRLSVFYYKQN